MSEEKLILDKSDEENNRILPNEENELTNKTNSIEQYPQNEENTVEKPSADPNSLSPVSSFKVNANSFKVEIKELFNKVIERNNEFNKKYKTFKDSLILSYKGLYRYWSCTCCCSCCHCTYCFFCCTKRKDSKSKTKEIKDKVKEIENIELKFSEEENEEKKPVDNEVSTCFLALLYILSVSHFFALSEIHSILLALMKEIIRTINFI